MTGNQFQALLDAHGLRHKDAAALLDVGVRTIERHVASKKVPRMVELAVRYVVQARAAAGMKPR
jgi:hypothetical protein